MAFTFHRIFAVAATRQLFLKLQLNRAWLIEIHYQSLSRTSILANVNNPKEEGFKVGKKKREGGAKDMKGVEREGGTKEEKEGGKGGEGRGVSKPLKKNIKKSKKKHK